MRASKWWNGEEKIADTSSRRTSRTILVWISSQRNAEILRIGRVIHGYREAKGRADSQSAFAMAAPAWAATLVVLMLVNYGIANLVFYGDLRVAKQPSGYAHGHRVISPYGLLVQILLIIEIVCIVLVKNRLSRKHMK